MVEITIPDNLTWEEIYERHMFGDPAGMTLEEYKDGVRKAIEAAKSMSEKEFRDKMETACRKWKEQQGEKE